MKLKTFDCPDEVITNDERHIKKFNIKQIVPIY